MPGYLSLDTETSVSYEIIQVQNKNKRIPYPDKSLSSSWRLPQNDFYTLIYATHPDNVKLLHKKQGFKRRLPFRLRQLLKQTHTIIGTNLKFDLGYIWHDAAFQQWLLNGGKVWDIQLVRYLLSAQRHAFPSLAEMQKIYLGIKTKKDRISYLFSKCIDAKEIIAARNRCKRVWKLYCEYGIEDGRTPMLIMKKQYAEAKSRGMLLIIELYNQYLLALTMMETNGLHIDIAQTEERYKDFSLKVVDYLRQAEEKVKHFWNDPRLPKFNVQSRTHASAILFGGEISSSWQEPTDRVYKSGDRKGQVVFKTVKGKIKVEGFGLPKLFTSKNKDGSYKTDNPVIHKIYEECKNEEAKEYCKLLKLSAAYKQKLSLYLNAFLYKSFNGVVYPNFNNTEVITGRLSSSNPNLQNLVKHGEFFKLIQGLIKAPEGWVCVQIDFSQLETYVRAWLSGDHNLTQDLLNGKCFHTQNVAWGEGISYEEAYDLCKIKKIKEWDEKRSKAKAITFGEAYGQMPESMVARSGLPLEIIQQIYKCMEENYPDTVTYIEKVQKEVEKSATLSRKSDLPEKYTRGTNDKKGFARKFYNGIEVLPIRERDKKTYTYDYEELRHVGYYQSPTGKVYAFEEFGSRKKDGTVYRYFKPTQMKNYALQGGAGDIQGMTTVALFTGLLKHPDKIKLVNEVHDSKWFYIKKEYLDLMLYKVHTIITSVRQLLDERFKIKIDFEFKADIEVGETFADMQPYKLEKKL